MRNEVLSNPTAIASTVKLIQGKVTGIGLRI
jgi:hypothetical protein